MKAAVVHDFSSPVVIEDVPIPEPSAERDLLNGLTFRGSIVGTHHDLEEVFALHRRGLTKVFRAEVALEDVNAAIEQVLDGSAPSPRLVFDPTATPSATPSADAVAVRRRG